MDADKRPLQKDVILQAAKAARTYTQDVEGRVFTLVMPSQHEMRVAYLRAGAERDDPALLHIILREVLKKSITDWSNVTVDDFMKNGDQKAVDFDSDLVLELMDAQDDWRDVLDKELTKRLSARAGSIEAAQKN